MGDREVASSRIERLNRAALRFGGDRAGKTQGSNPVALTAAMVDAFVDGLRDGKPLPAAAYAARNAGGKSMSPAQGRMILRMIQRRRIDLDAAEPVAEIG